MKKFINHIFLLGVLIIAPMVSAEEKKFGINLEYRPREYLAKEKIYIHVKDVDWHGPAAAAGVRVGDKLIAISNTPIKYISQVGVLLGRTDKSKPLPIVVQRGKGFHSLSVDFNKMNTAYSNMKFEPSGDPIIDCYHSPSEVCLKEAGYFGGINPKSDDKKKSRPILESRYLDKVKTEPRCSRIDTFDRYIIYLSGLEPLQEFMDIIFNPNACDSVYVKGANILLKNGYSDLARPIVDIALERFIQKKPREHIFPLEYADMLSYEGNIFLTDKIYSIGKENIDHKWDLSFRNRMSENLYRNGSPLFAKLYSDMAVATTALYFQAGADYVALIQNLRAINDKKGIDDVVTNLETWLNNRPDLAGRIVPHLIEVYGVLGRLEAADELIDRYSKDVMDKLMLRMRLDIAASEHLPVAKWSFGHIKNLPSHIVETSNLLKSEIGKSQDQKFERISEEDAIKFYGLMARVYADKFAIGEFKGVVFNTSKMKEAINRTHNKEVFVAIIDALLEMESVNMALEWVREYEKHDMSESKKLYPEIFRQAAGTMSAWELAKLQKDEKYSKLYSDYTLRELSRRSYILGDKENYVGYVKQMDINKGFLVDRFDFFKNQCNVCQY